jgi:hypothetical protein
VNCESNGIKCEGYYQIEVLTQEAIVSLGSKKLERDHGGPRITDLLFSPKETELNQYLPHSKAQLEPQDQSNTIAPSVQPLDDTSVYTQHALTRDNLLERKLREAGLTEVHDSVRTESISSPTNLTLANVTRVSDDQKRADLSAVRKPRESFSRTPASRSAFGGKAMSGVDGGPSQVSANERALDRKMETNASSPETLDADGSGELGMYQYFV